MLVQKNLAFIFGLLYSSLIDLIFISLNSTVLSFSSSPFFQTSYIFFLKKEKTHTKVQSTVYCRLALKKEGFAQECNHGQEYIFVPSFFSVRQTFTLFKICKQPHVIQKVKYQPLLVICLLIQKGSCIIDVCTYLSCQASRFPT